MFILEGRDISLCRIVFTLYLSSNGLQNTLSSRCLFKPCCFAAHLCGALALGVPLASLVLLVLWCGCLLGGVQQACLDSSWSHVVVWQHTSDLEVNYFILFFILKPDPVGGLALGPAGSSLWLAVLMLWSGCLGIVVAWPIHIFILLFNTFLSLSKLWKKVVKITYDAS